MIEITDSELVQAKRDVSAHGVGLVFLVNGLLLLLFWMLCYRALGGVLSAHVDELPALAFNGYSALAFACLGYIVVMDMDTAFRDGREACRRITLDWLWFGLLPVAGYIAVSTAAFSWFVEPRHTAALQGLLSAALILYGLSLTRIHFSARAPS